LLLQERYHHAKEHHNYEIIGHFIILFFVFATYTTLISEVMYKNDISITMPK